LMQFDKDGDKKISREESEGTFMSNFFDDIDSNKDGFVDAAENAALRARMQKKAGGGGPGGRGPGGGGPGGGGPGGP